MASGDQECNRGKLEQHADTQVNRAVKDDSSINTLCSIDSYTCGAHVV